MSMIRSSRILLPALVGLSSFIASGQVPGSTTPATPPVNCAPLAPNLAIPSRAAIEAKVTSLDSAHLKAGSSIWFKTARPFYYPGCLLDTDSVVYAHVLSVSPSEISLLFDRADCNHRDQQPVRLRVVAIVGPPSQLHHMHDDLPSEVAGGARQIAQAVYGTDALDEDLNPGGPPHTIHPGVVLGIKNLKLEPTAGQGCGDRISTEGNRIQLESGSELILAMTVIRPSHKQPAPPAAKPNP